MRVASCGLRAAGNEVREKKEAHDVRRTAHGSEKGVRLEGKVNSAFPLPNSDYCLLTTDISLILLTIPFILNI